MWLALLPWLPLGVLLLLKPNRVAAAWWILVPVGVVLGSLASLNQLSVVPSVVEGIFAEAITALTFGLAMVWLLAPSLARKHRFLTWLCMVPTFAVASGLTSLLRADWGDGVAIEMMQTIAFGGFGLGAISLALFLAGCVCRRGYAAGRFLVATAGFILVIWLTVMTPFFIIAVVASGDSIPWTEFLGGLLMVVGITFGIVLPFLVLSFLNGFHRERLRMLFPMGERTPPPSPEPMPPPPPLAASAAGSA